MTEDTKIDPQEVMIIHEIVDGEDTKGWVHTHGLEKFDLPELEIRGCPLFLMSFAGYLLNEIADYFLNESKEVKLGENMQLGPCLFSFAKLDPIKGQDDHFKMKRWAITDVDNCHQCEECGCDISSYKH